MNLLKKVAFLFALLIAGMSSLQAQTLKRGPYLQMGSTSAVTVCWRTSTATSSVVRYGTSPDNLNLTASDSESKTDHKIRLSGLASDTKYYYSVGNASATFASGADYFFVTAPTSGKPTRIWVIGDAGTADNNQRAVRDAYYTFTGSRHTDLWLMLGDNAYSVGTDEEYQRAVFDIYQGLLRKSVLWSTLGNHDGYTADSATQTGPYYDIFTLPTQAEAGGVASGTEAYYSFDYGNIHFVCLDSYETDRSSTAAMATWLKNDLAENTKDWTIAFFHHPPYSKGSHDSDWETELVEMRQEIVPILEEYGIDLVLSGHCHSYERSKFIDGHYGTSSTFDNSMVVQAGSGRVDEAGAYTKSAAGPLSHAGTVYAVAGASGQTSGGSLNHPAMYLSLNVLGSLVLDVDGGRLDVQYIDQTGARRDYFTLSKETGNEAPTVSITTPLNGATFTAPPSVTIDAVATDEDGSVSKVDFYADSTLIGSDDTAPFSVTWSNPSSGIHGLRAVATDNLGASKTSSVVSITVESSPGRITASFQNGVNGYAGTQDTKLKQRAPGANYNSSNTLEMDGIPKSSAVVQWDLSAIPIGSRVLSVTLEFNVTNRSSQKYEIYALKRAWTESGATWRNAQLGERWQVAGANGKADRERTVLGKISAAANGRKSVTLNSNGVAQVQAWVNEPVRNHGFIIVDYKNFDGLELSSSESNIVSKRPKITVTYERAQME